MTNEEFFDKEIKAGRMVYEKGVVTYSHQRGHEVKWRWKRTNGTVSRGPRVFVRSGKARYNISLGRLIFRIAHGEWTDPKTEFVMESPLTHQLFVKPHKKEKSDVV